jgi:hypothetical protein
VRGRRQEAGGASPVGCLGRAARRLACARLERGLAQAPRPRPPPRPRPARRPTAASPSYSLAPLIDDCKLLGILLDDCLKADVGTELFNKARGGPGKGGGEGEGERGGRSGGECRRAQRQASSVWQSWRG